MDNRDIKNETASPACCDHNAEEGVELEDSLGFDFRAEVEKHATGEAKHLAIAINDAMNDICYNVLGAIVAKANRELTECEYNIVRTKMEEVLGGWLHKWISENY